MKINLNSSFIFIKSRLCLSHMISLMTIGTFLQTDVFFFQFRNLRLWIIMTSSSMTIQARFINRLGLDRMKPFCGQLKILDVFSRFFVDFILTRIRRLLIKFTSTSRVKQVILDVLTLLCFLTLSF